MTTFDELFSQHRLTKRERELLIHHLAAMRYRKTIERLLKPKKLIIAAEEER